MSGDRYVIAVRDPEASEVGWPVWRIQTRHPTFAAALEHAVGLDLPVSDVNVETIEEFKEMAVVERREHAALARRGRVL